MYLNPSKNILLIDDDHDNRVALRMVLESNGYSVHTAANGQIALNLLDKMKSLPDLILLDMVMPLMDGEEFMKVVEAHDLYRELKILIITSFRDKLSSRQDKKPVLLKPVDLNEFISKVNSYF